MTNVSTNYFSTLSPLFDAALCTSKRLYPAVQKMTSIIVDYNDSSIQPFHMLSSSPTTMSMTFKTSDQVPNETTPLWKTYPLFCTHVTHVTHDIIEPRKHRLSRISGKKMVCSMLYVFHSELCTSLSSPYIPVIFLIYPLRWKL